MKTTNLILHWTPRVICILAILFVSMFAFDVFSPQLTVWQEILGLLIHLIPSFILLGLLIVAWKWEMVGGVILTIIGVVFGVGVFLLNYKRIHSVGISLGIVAMICLPFVLSGILFIISHDRKN